MNNELPIIPPSLFGRLLIERNGLKDTFKELVLLPAMLNGGGDKWWGDMGRRPVLHEGIDIVAWHSESRRVSFFGGGIKIPAMYNGRVETIIPDFLGQSVFIRHPRFRKDDLTFYTVYGHTAPDESIQAGSTVKEGDIIGTIAPAKKSGAVRPHLHISAMWLPDKMIPEAFDWAVIGTSPDIRLVDPLTLIGLPYTVVDGIG